MSERKLATVRIVSSKAPIEGADFIETVMIDGWQCIVKKGEMQPGDKVIYFEIDSFLPVREEFEFLRKSSYKRMEGDKEGFRLKTMKLRGTLSQGLAVEFSLLNLNPDDYNVGDDLTSILNVELYEPPIPISLRGQVKSTFPSFIPKTDQERIQNIPEYFQRYKDKQYEVTVKLDGTSSTNYFKDGEFGVCSRNMDLIETEENLYWQVANKLRLRDILSELNMNIALQGEIVGPGIQKNRAKLSEITFFLFDIYDIDNQIYLAPEERLSLLKEINKIAENYNTIIKHVPIYCMPCPFFDYFPTMEEALEAADGNTLLDPATTREGIVCKPMEASKQRNSFKIISNEYLLKNDG